MNAWRPGFKPRLLRSSIVAPRIVFAVRDAIIVRICASSSASALGGSESSV
jgi:hypothetical protein